MIDKLKNYFWPVKDDYGKKLSHEETLEYCKSRFSIVALISIVVISLCYFCFSIQMGTDDQSTKSEFTDISNVKITDFDYWTRGAHTRQSYCYVDFVLNGHKYKHMLVIGSDRDENGLPVSYPCFTKFIDAYNFDFSEFKYGYGDFPALVQVLSYAHDSRIKRGTYALQTNKHLPSIGWQLRHQEVCLVGNVTK